MSERVFLLKIRLKIHFKVNFLKCYIKKVKEFHLLNFERIRSEQRTYYQRRTTTVWNLNPCLAKLKFTCIINLNYQQRIKYIKKNFMCKLACIPETLHHKLLNQLNFHNLRENNAFDIKLIISQNVALNHITIYKYKVWVLNNVSKILKTNQ